MGTCSESRVSGESAHTGAPGTDPRGLDTQQHIDSYCCCLSWQQDTLSTLQANHHIPIYQRNYILGWVKKRGHDTGRKINSRWKHRKNTQKASTFTSLPKCPDVMGLAEIELIFPTVVKEKYVKEEEGWAFVLYNIGCLEQLLQVLEPCLPDRGQVSHVDGNKRIKPLVFSVDYACTTFHFCFSKNALSQTMSCFPLYYLSLVQPRRGCERASWWAPGI